MDSKQRQELTDLLLAELAKADSAEQFRLRFHRVLTPVSPATIAERLEQEPPTPREELSDVLAELDATHFRVRELGTFLDQLYEERAKILVAFALLCKTIGHRVGFRDDPKTPGWPVLFIDLPEGQVSWHFSAEMREGIAGEIGVYLDEWDGHTTEQKYERLAAFARGRAEFARMWGA